MVHGNLIHRLRILLMNDFEHHRDEKLNKNNCLQRDDAVVKIDQLLREGQISKDLIFCKYLLQIL